jgi:DNA polymerase-3 subunit gamma/tau
MSKALYRKYRSKSLGELIGQKHITDILSRALSTGKISHAYLLTGPRGVGKTSVARILAHEINGIDYDEDSLNLDIIEIDAASNNGVEDVRDLREKVQIAPVAAKKKIYIIDEVHMLSKAAFNALLKTLEEPPEHVVFILATTNVEKLPATIISRAQRFNFRPISINDATIHLKDIAKKEDIKIDNAALELIADRSDGSFRDSISLLDQLSGLVDAKDTITVDLIEDALGMAPSKIIDRLIESIDNKDIGLLVRTLDETFNEGIDSAILVSQLTRRISDQIAEKPQLIPLLDALIDVPKSSQPQLKLLAVLGMAINQKQPTKTIALAAPAREISASIDELEKQALKPKPKIVKKAAIPKSETSVFDWKKLIEYTRQNYIALYSVLLKCNYELDGNDITIYTSNGFYKKKLDDAKYSSLLSKCFQETGVYGLDIHTIPTTPPLKDSQAAAIAAIMGGGEEVSLEPAG